MNISTLHNQVYFSSFNPMNIFLVDDDNTANFIAKRLIEKIFQRKHWLI